jgi:hypothetical protein
MCSNQGSHMRRIFSPPSVACVGLAVSGSNCKYQHSGKFDRPSVFRIPARIFDAFEGACAATAGLRGPHSDGLVFPRVDQFDPTILEIRRIACGQLSAM